MRPLPCRYLEFFVKKNTQTFRVETPCGYPADTLLALRTRDGRYFDIVTDRNIRPGSDRFFATINGTATGIIIETGRSRNEILFDSNDPDQRIPVVLGQLVLIICPHPAVYDLHPDELNPHRDGHVTNTLNVRARKPHPSRPPSPEDLVASRS